LKKRRVAPSNTASMDRYTLPPMRIALDLSIQDTPWVTGVERTQLAILRELVELDGANEYLLISRKAVALPFPLPPNFRTIDLSPSKPGYLWRESVLAPLLTKENVDVFHSPVNAIPVGGDCAKIATVHEVPWLERNSGVEASRRVWLYLNTRWARRIVAVSERTRANIVKLYPAAKEKVVVIHPGIDERFVPSQDGATRATALTALGLPDEPYLLFVGAARRKKNVQGLLHSFAQLPEELRRTTQLVLAGVRNPAESGLDARARQLGIADRVRFPGYVRDADLVQLYQHATALVFPSLFEGFGIPPLEAMACGTPVIASTGGALPEVVGAAALLVQPNDVQQLAAAMRRMLTNEALRADLRRRGLERAPRFTWRRAAEQVLDLYRSCGAKAATA
jgi:glycosyltransferase involved in cell wall biosynthesis